MALPEKEAVVSLARWARKYYDLQDAWAFVKSIHTPKLAYHNLTHLRIVTGAAVSLAWRTGADPRLAAIAAMFHDAGHAGHSRTQLDDANVETALYWLETYNNLGDKYCTKPLLDKEELVLVSYAIRSTMYLGGAFPNPPTTPLACVLRDADLWNPHLRPANLRHMVAGLGKELQAWDETTLDVGFENVIKFFETVTWHTKPGQGAAKDVRTRLQIACGNQNEDDAMRWTGQGE